MSYCTKALLHDHNFCACDGITGPKTSLCSSESRGTRKPIVFYDRRRHLFCRSFENILILTLTCRLSHLISDSNAIPSTNDRSCVIASYITN